MLADPFVKTTERAGGRANVHTNATSSVNLMLHNSYDNTFYVLQATSGARIAFTHISAHIMYTDTYTHTVAAQSDFLEGTFDVAYDALEIMYYIKWLISKGICEEVVMW